jgi:hypothetical protein
MKMENKCWKMENKRLKKIWENKRTREKSLKNTMAIWTRFGPLPGVARPAGAVAAAGVRTPAEW